VTEQPARARARDRGDQGGGERGVVAPRAARAPAALGILRILAWVAGYAVAAWLGHRSALEGSGFTLFWPASGMALVWIATARWRRVELAVVALLAAGMLALLDSSVWQAVDALVGVPCGLVVFLVLSRAWAPGLWGTGGDRQVDTLREYGLLVAAAAVAAVTEALVASVLLLPEPGRPWEATTELALPHLVGMVVVGATVLILGGWLAGLPGEGRGASRVLAAVRRDTSRSDAVILATTGVLTVLAFLAGFFWLTDAPVTFVLVMVIVGVGIRFSAPTTGLVALTVTAAAWWLTAVGHGPIAEIPEPHRRALAFGLFALALVVTGLTIAVSRRERDAVIGRLRESERAAEVLADDLALVLANLEEGVAVVEEGGRFIHANAAIGRLLEMPDFDDERVAPVGTYHLAHLDGRPLAESEVPHVRAFAGEEDVHDVLRLVRPGATHDRIFEVSSRLLPQIRDTDKPRAVTMIRDATIEHQQRDALASFAQVVAHDLRSPLTSIELWARELLDGYAQGDVDTETATMMVRHVESAAGRMQNFISDLLAYALARDQTPSPVRLELVDVVESVVETITAVEGVQPEVQYADLPEVWCDPVLVPQLFDNLIGNARKYVAEGVVPQVRIEATPISEDWARVRIIDNGIGIAPEDRLRVFETFERARANEYEGTGLGLAICRHIVERHGGTIGVTTPPSGAGTCIELTLPMTDGAFDRATTRTPT
jgi:signal transduction histidine kinase